MLILRVVDSRVTGEVGEAGRTRQQQRLFPARCGLWPLQAVSPEQTHLLQPLPGEPHALLMIDCPSWGFPGSSCSVLGSCSVGAFLTIFPRELLRSCFKGWWMWLPAACVCPPTDSCLWQEQTQTPELAVTLCATALRPGWLNPPRAVGWSRSILLTVPNGCRDGESQQALGRRQDPVLVDVLMYDLTPADSRDGAFVPRTGKLLKVL